MKNVELIKIVKKELRGRPFDEHRCFYIKDFNRGDSIRVKFRRNGKPIRGVVTSVDLETNVISFKTAEDEDGRATIDKIVTLEEHNRSWLG
jgi:small nuclear ribonucleoprotein (snRNP)-like protein